MELQAQDNITISARALRRELKVPAIVYGHQKPPSRIALERKMFEKACHDANIFSRIVQLKYDNTTEDVIVKEVQRDPVTSVIRHADFMRIDKNSKIRMNIPIDFVNADKSPAIKQGGVLNIIMHTLEVKCSPYDVPETLTCDLSKLAMHEAVRLSDMHLPSNVVPVHPKRLNILATVVASTGLSEGDKGKEAEGTA